MTNTKLRIRQPAMSPEKSTLLAVFTQKFEKEWEKKPLVKSLINKINKCGLACLSKPHTQLSSVQHCFYVTAALPVRQWQKADFPHESRFKKVLHKSRRSWQNKRRLICFSTYFPRRNAKSVKFTL